MNDRPLRLLVIDDSALYRQLVDDQKLREIAGVEVVQHSQRAARRR